MNFGIELYGIASTARTQEPFVEVAELSDIGRLAGKVDYVINLLPDTAQTQDIFDAKLFAQFNPNGLFINVGRGVAVVDADLVSALKEGHLAGAVIDVCRQEPLPQRHPFWTAWGLLLTGHSSGPTSPDLMTKLFIENLKAFTASESLQGEVDFLKGY
jgi:phosphoglycerate dehydrogenase-like enzyme